MADHGSGLCILAHWLGFLIRGDALISHVTILAISFQHHSLSIPYFFQFLLIKFSFSCQYGIKLPFRQGTWTAPETADHREWSVHDSSLVKVSRGESDRVECTTMSWHLFLLCHCSNSPVQFRVNPFFLKKIQLPLWWWIASLLGAFESSRNGRSWEWSMHAPLLIRVSTGLHSCYFISAPFSSLNSLFPNNYVWTPYICVLQSAMHYNCLKLVCCILHL